MTTNNVISNQVHHVHQTRGRLLLATGLSILLASTANLALYLIVGAIIPEVGAWPGAGVGQIVGATVVYLVVGAVAMAVIRRWSSRPADLYRIVATIGLLLSLVLPISAAYGYGAPGAPPASAATAITLSMMHVVAYAISVPLTIRLALNREI